ncbi:MAG: N-acetylmuramic acid 6-phosphate etherase [Brevundimonas sp.]|jgi:N-acetylmuramic acid 6-phosphate etherase
MSNTETIDPRYVDIDSWPLDVAIDAMLEGQLSAIASLRDQVPAIASASEAAALRLRAGGRLVYVGAGTSGRIAVQDGVELTPTFGWPEDRLVFALAGGLESLVVSAEGAEDDREDAVDQLQARSVGAADVVIGVAASGRTPFTLSALAWARDQGALTIGLANNAQTPLVDGADFPIVARTGSELIAGSTRMKAGTSQKAALNMLSTAIMLRLGRVYRGLMVDMVISNDKLLRRAEGMVDLLSGCGPTAAAAALSDAHNNIKTAVLVARGVEVSSAADLLARHDGALRPALAEAEANPA